MTAPRLYTGGPQLTYSRAEQEHEEFMRQMQSMFAGAVSTPAVGAPVLGNTVMPGPTNPVPIERERSENLIGRAKYWGMPEETAAAMHEDQLRAFLYSMEALVQPQGGQQGATYDAFASYAAGLPVGAMQAGTSLFKNLPFVGEWFQKREWIKQADQWLGGLEERVRSNTSLEDQMLVTTGSVVGNAATMWYPAAGAWNLAGAVGKWRPLAAVGTKITSPIIRMAAQGGASAWLLEGGSEHPAAAVAGGAALGGLGGAGELAIRRYGPSLSAAASRVTEAFSGPWKDRTRLSIIPDVGGLTGSGTRPQLGPQTEAGFVGPIQAEVQSPAEQSLIQAYHSAPDSETRQSLAALITELQRSRLGGARDASGMEIPLGPEPITGYHGTGEAFNEIRTPAFFAKDRAAAQDYADQFDNPVVREAQLRFKNTAPPEVVAAVSKRLFGDEEAVFRDDWYNVEPIIEELKRMGYDSALHHDLTPGMGQAMESFIAFEPSQVKFTDEIAEASAMAAQMQKAALLTESSTLPAAAGEAAVDEGTVARAVSLDNPGGTNVVPGIADPVGFGKQIAGSGQNFRFVRRPGSRKMDVLLSDLPITDQMAADYERVGMFQGMTVTTKQGVEATISGPLTGEDVLVKPVYGGKPRRVKVSNLMPQPKTHDKLEIPVTYEAFMGFATARAEIAARASGIPTPEGIAQMRNENLPIYLDDFMDLIKPPTVGEGARIKEGINEAFVNEYAATEPEAAAFQETMAQLAGESEVTSAVSPTSRLQQKASSKGFIAVPRENGSWDIIESVGDVSSPPSSINFQSREAAEEWVTRLHRELPDISPATDVPGEVMQRVPTMSQQDPPMPHADDMHRLAADAVEDAAQTIEVESGDQGLADYLRAEVQRATEAGDLGRVQRAWEYGLSKLQPMRAYWAGVERKLGQLGPQYEDMRPWKDYDAVSTAVVHMHNETAPLHTEAAGISARWAKAAHRNGEVTEVFQIMDPAKRVEHARLKGWDADQIQGLQMMEDFINKVVGKPGAADEIRAMLATIRARQVLGLDESTAMQLGQITDATRPLFDYLKGSNTNLAELDARNLLNMIIRSHMFAKHVAPVWNPAVQKWNEIGNITLEGTQDNKPFAGVARSMDNWLKIAKFGYNPRDDQAMEFIHTVMSAVVPGITPAQIRVMFGQGMSTTHRALLGLRPDVWARDSMQLLLAMPRVGMDLPAAVLEYVNANKAARQQIWDRALEGAWVTRGMPRIASPGAFETPTVFIEGEAVTQTPQSLRYRGIQKALDAVDYMLPEKLRHIEGSPLDPLYIYTKQSERMRLVVGHAMARRADRSIDAFRKAGENGSLETLMGDTGARTFEPAVQQRFKEFIASGNDREAANFLARQLVDATQFKYGLLENPAIGRSMTGRVFMQMGNFSTQFYQYLKESLRYGTWGDKVKFGMWMGGIGYAFDYATEKTGWNFNKWQFAPSLMFTGGPWAQQAADAISGSRAMSQMGQQAVGGQAATGNPQFLMDEANRLPSAITAGIEALNPLQGGLRTYTGVREAFESPTPGAALGRLFLTGERGAAPDWRNVFRETFGSQPTPAPTPDVQGMTMQPSPVRGNAIVDPGSLVPAMPNPGGYAPGAVGGVGGGGSGGASPLDTNYTAIQPGYIPPGTPTDIRRLPAETITSIARELDGLATGTYRNDQLTAEDRDFLESIRRHDDSTRVQAWLYYQDSKRSRPAARPVPAGHPGSGAF